jgi:hypothetical protein
MKFHHYGLAATITAVFCVFLGLAILLTPVFFAVIALGGVIVGLWIYIELRRRHLPIAEHQHKQLIADRDYELQQRVIAHGEKHRGSIKRDANGTIEVIISHHQVQVVEEQQEQLQIEAPAIPSVVRYEDVAAQIPRGHSLLGISENGLETCDFNDLMTMLISGGSSTGKSNTVAIKLHEAVKIGKNTRMIVIDPHKNKPDSLYNKIRQYEQRFLTPVAFRDEEIIQSLNWFRHEFQRRMELSTNELERLPDILLVCDEVYGLVNHREDDRIAKLIKIVSGIAGYESRGYGMFAWFLTQKVSGLKWLRDAVMTTICHKMQTMSERVLASNDDRQVAKDMNNWTMPGRVVVFGLNLPVTVTQMPLMHVVDALPASNARAFQPQQAEDFGRSWEANGEDDGRERNTDETFSPLVLKKFLNEAGKMRANGESIDGILKAHGLTAGGRNNQNLKHLLEQQAEQEA